MFFSWLIYRGYPPPKIQNPKSMLQNQYLITSNAPSMELEQYCNSQGIKAMVTAMVKDVKPILLLLLQRVTNS